MLFSVIIRTKNEEQFIGQTLKMIFAQGFGVGELEVIVVDSGSTDRTLEIVAEFEVKVIKIASEDFSYPYASNIGAKEARGEYLVYLSGHSVPIHDTILRDALTCWRKLELGNVKLAGVYGPIAALPGKGSSLWEKMIFPAHRLRKLQPKAITQKQMGLLGCTNAIIRRDIWQQHQFDERYGLGGEDTVWAAARIKEGYSIGFCPCFAVYHSHGLGLIGLYKQWQHWQGNLNNPQSFDATKMHYRD